MRKATADKIQRKILDARAYLHSLEAFDNNCWDSVYKAAGLVLKDIRSEKQLGQKSICDALGMPQATYSQIENGRYNVGLHRYMEILTHLDVDFTAFINRVKEKQANG
jgi:DNA-binding XRE family transcriptional regulator